MTAPTRLAALYQELTVRAVRITAIVACLFGAAVLAWQFGRYLPVFPAASVLAVAVELPLLVVGFVLLRLARPVRSPPTVWAAAALIWGGTAAAGCALLANQGLTSLWAKSQGPQFAANWSAPLSAPLNEELLKLCGVVMVIMAAPLLVRGALDGWVYGALTGLGFQVTENITYGLNSISLSGAADPDQAVVSSVLARVLQAGLGSHWTLTAVAGAGVGFLVARLRDGGRGGPLVAASCLLAALLMHLLFDAPYLPLAIKVAVNLLVAGGLYVVLRNSRLSRAQRLLDARVTAGLVTDDEAAGLLSRYRRRRALRQAPPGAPRELLHNRQERLLADLDGDVE
jgi:RsiW-degrading membrane proteinase PrsW (M82 family)